MNQTLHFYRQSYQPYTYKNNLKTERGRRTALRGLGLIPRREPSDYKSSESSEKRSADGADPEIAQIRDFAFAPKHVNQARGAGAVQTAHLSITSDARE